jgi:hypothetical protein
MTTELQPTDIEIYVSNLSQAQALQWLEKEFGTLNPLRKRKGMPKKAQLFEANWRAKAFQIMIFEEVIPSYTSIWLDQTDLPWEDDSACAQVAAKFFNSAVRVTAGGWQDKADPDAWLEFLPDGTSQTLIWKT